MARPDLGDGFSTKQIIKSIKVTKAQVSNFKATLSKPTIPLSIFGDIKTINITKEMLYWYPWIDNIKHKNVYLSLNLRWGPNGEYPSPPPPGYDYYISHGDSLMFGWPEHVINNVDGKIIHLTGALILDSFDTDRIQYVPHNTAHKRIRGVAITDIDKDIQFKTSALTNRVTQSKAIIFAALMSILREKNCVASLHHDLHNTKNIHSWKPSGNSTCDYYLNLFKEQWTDKKILLPQDDQVTWSCNNSAYRTAALNFTQESYHYSYMVKNGCGYTEPGPFVTEKTWKCLMSATAFISVGQAYVYQWFKQLGLQFNYGELDLSFDNDAGNLTRIEKIVNLIQSLTQWSAHDLYEMTYESTLHNFEHVQSQKFWDICEESNTETYKLLNNL